MRAIVVLAALLLAGCASTPASDLSGSLADADGDGFLDAVEVAYGSDPENATSIPDVQERKDVSFSDTASVVGTGVPSVQCPADDVNTDVLEWTVDAPPGNLTDVHVAGLAFKAEGAATVNDVDLFVFGPEGDYLGSATGSTASETIEIPGKRPVGTYRIEARGCSGAGDVAIQATGILAWIPSNEDLLEPRGA